MPSLRSTSIRSRVQNAAFSVIAVAVPVVVVLSITLVFFGMKSRLMNGLNVQASYLAEQLAAPLSQADQAQALKTMDWVRSVSELEQLSVRTNSGQVFAEFERTGRNQTTLDTPDSLMGRFSHQQISRPIIFQGQRLGSLYVDISLDAFYRQALAFGTAILLLAALTLGIAHVALKRVATRAVRPLSELAAMIGTAAKTANFSQRVSWHNLGEVNQLAQTFNAMLDSFQFKTDVLNAELQERMLAEARLDNLAHYDPVTGLANRIQFHKELPRAAERAKRQGNNIALIFLDLDDFKVVNDTLGHDVGDYLLYSVGKRLTENVRTGDMVCRLGGDEFTVILEGQTSLKVAVDIVSKLIESIGEVYEICGHNLHVKVSAGISIYPTQTDDVRDLLRFADLAMYQAKSNGKNDYCVYTSDLFSRANERLVIESELRQGIKNNEFFLVYQPQVNIRTGAIVGLEALVRWQHPRRGLVAPNNFIDIAEKSGLIVPLGRKVIELACQQWQSWRKQGMEPPILAINVSGLQLADEKFADELMAAVNACGKPRPKIELEITESLLLSDTMISKAMMHRLAAAGIEWSLDDFGTGYSSLTYLAKFPISNIKIDRSFIARLPGDKSSEAIVRAIITMAAGLGMRVITEGVETREQLEYLATLGDIVAQGYYFHRPLLADEISDILRVRKITKPIENPRLLEISERYRLAGTSAG